jgi:hypothetical protein
LRQAYDYWQNQPGNYLDAEAAPEGDGQGSTPGGAEVAIGRGEDESKPGHGCTSRLRRGSRDHPFAPTEFPKGWSTTEARATREGVDRSAVCTPQEEDARNDHSDRGRRLLNRACPQESGEILSQRPTIHRPQPTRKAGPIGVRLPHRLAATVTDRDGFARLGQETFAAAGTWSGRSASG